jgi:hypothetical protein
MITIFKNIRETSTPFHRSIEFVLNRIKDGKHRDLISSIRKEKNKTKRNDLKKNLPAICFSGTFSKRSDDAVMKHSGYICLDFDGYETDDQMQQERQRLMDDKYVMSVFISPSGNGLKAIVKIPEDVEGHKKYFDALQEYFDSDNFDVTSKNLSRVCYESYDPDIYINEKSKLWEKKLEDSYRSVDIKDRPTIPITDDNKIVEILIKWWTKKYPMRGSKKQQRIYTCISIKRVWYK